MNLEIANRLIKMRKEHGFSQEELAAELGISRQAVSKWERGESAPDTDNLIMLAKLYNVSIDELLGLNGEPNNETESERSDNRKSEKTSFNFHNGLNVHDSDGTNVHIGFDGIHVHPGRESHDRSKVDIGWKGIHVNEADDDYDEESDGREADFSVGDGGVYIDEDGERVFHPWNKTGKDGKRKYVRKEKVGNKWHTVIITEDGHKVELNTKREPNLDEDDSLTFDFHMSGFPYTLLITGAFLLLGFIWNLWHPAWILFLTIPIYYAIARGVKRHSVNVLSILFPIAVVGIYIALGILYGLWHPLWVILLIIPTFQGFIFGSGNGQNIPVKLWIVLITIAYFALGFVFGAKAWRVTWLLLFTIPMFKSIVSSIQNRVGIRCLSRFPWEILITTAYLFVGLMYGIWHPTWIAFLLIPVLRWVINAIVHAFAHEDKVAYDADIDYDADVDEYE